MWPIYHTIMDDIDKTILDIAIAVRPLPQRLANRVVALCTKRSLPSAIIALASLSLYAVLSPWRNR